MSMNRGSSTQSSSMQNELTESVTLDPNVARGNVPLRIIARKRFARKKSARYRTPPVVVTGQHTIHYECCCYVSPRGYDFRGRLFVCLSVCPEHNSKTNDPKVFKLSTSDILLVTWFWVERSKVNVRVNSNTAWVRTL